LIAHFAIAVMLAAGSATVATAEDEPAEEATRPEPTALRTDLIEAGHSNGLLPSDQLTEIESSLGCFLEEQAAVAWLQLEAHALTDGFELVARWCYRSLLTQRATYERNCPLLPVQTHGNPAADDVLAISAPPQMMRRCSPPTAKPGNSNHGWGRAADIKLGGRLLKCDSPGFQWLVDNAATYGWVHPPWAACGEPKEEAWHWEWGGLPPPEEEPEFSRLSEWLAELAMGAGRTTSGGNAVYPDYVNAFLVGADPE